MRFTKYKAAVLALCISYLYQNKTAHAVPDSDWPSNENRIDARCTPDLTTKHFDPDKKLHLLLLRFNGSDTQERECGHKLARNYLLELPRFLEGLSPQNAWKPYAADLRELKQELEIHYVPCSVDTDEQARSIARAWGGDLVLWGYTSLRQLKPKISPIGVQIIDKDAKATQINLSHPVPPPECSNVLLHPHVTAAIDALQTSSRNGLDSRHIMDLSGDFPQLLPDRTGALLFYSLGDLATRMGRHKLAKELLVRAVTLDGLEPIQRSGLLVATGLGFARRGHPLESEKLLKQAWGLCPRDDNFCLGRVRNAMVVTLFEQQNFPAALAAAKDAYELLSQSSGKQQAREALANWGIVLEALGRPSEALIKLREAERQQSEANESNANTRNSIGRILANQEKWDAALIEFRAAQLGFQKSKNASSEALATNNVGFTLLNLGRQKEARQVLETALASFQNLDESAGQILAMSNLGWLLLAADEKAEALAQFRSAVQKAKEAHDYLGTGRALRGIASCQMRLKQPAQARITYRQSIASLKLSGSIDNQADTLMELARYEMEMNNPEEAKSLWVEAYQILRPTQLTVLLLRVTTALTDFYHRRQDIMTALKWGKESLAYANQEKDPAWLTIANWNLGLIYTALNRSSESVPYFRDAAAQSQTSPNLRLHLDALVRLGVALANSSDKAGSLPVLESALTALSKFPESRSERAELITIQGEILIGLQRTGEGQEKLLQALAEFRTLPMTDRIQGEIERTLARLTLSQAPVLALSYLSAAEVHFGNSGQSDARIQIGLQRAAIMHTLGQIDEAESQFHTVLHWAEHISNAKQVQAAIWLDLGQLLAKDRLDFANAAEAYQRALALWTDLGNEIQGIYSLDGLAYAKRDHGDYSEAIIYLQKLADSIDRYLQTVEDPLSEDDLRIRRRTALHDAFLIASLHLKQVPLTEQLSRRLDTLAAQDIAFILNPAPHVASASKQP